MAKEETKKTQIDQEDLSLGEVQIADEVVAIIAGLAASEVEGVASLAYNQGKDRAGRFGVKNMSKGVKVDVLEGVVNVDMILQLDYGYGIPATSRKVQEKVKSAIENMTGLEVCEVNVRIAGVNVDRSR